MWKYIFVMKHTLQTVIQKKWIIDSHITFLNLFSSKAGNSLIDRRNGAQPSIVDYKTLLHLNAVFWEVSDIHEILH